MNDFLIIGGGIAGISAAARLSSLGQVLVLEAEDHIGYHASGRSAALFEENYGPPTTVVLNQASRAYHESAGTLSPRGFLLVAQDHERAEFERDCRALQLSQVTFEDAATHFPIINQERVAFAAYSDAAMDIDTDLLLQGFAKEARALGGEVITSARVEKVDRLDAGWSVETSQGTFCGRILINAAGAWADQVAQISGVSPLGFTPLRRSVARIAAPASQDLRNWPMLFGVGETWYAKPDAGALIVSPADEDPTEPHDAWADDLTIAEGLARYQEMVTEPVTRPLATWAGLRTFAPDRLFVIGFDPSDSAFFWLAGQGGYGMQSSPAASLLAADLIAGRQPMLEASIVSALSPERFS